MRAQLLRAHLQRECGSCLCLDVVKSMDTLYSEAESEEAIKIVITVKVSQNPEGALRDISHEELRLVVQRT